MRQGYVKMRLCCHERFITGGLMVGLCMGNLACGWPWWNVMQVILFVERNSLHFILNPMNSPWFLYPGLCCWLVICDHRFTSACFISDFTCFRQCNITPGNFLNIDGSIKNVFRWWNLSLSSVLDSVGLNVNMDRWLYGEAGSSFLRSCLSMWHVHMGVFSVKVLRVCGKGF